MNIPSDLQQSSTALTTTYYDVVVLGAGPYGLSVSAHLRGQGLNVATFGKPIYFWREHMPQGMLLRSYWWATSLSDPLGKYAFDKYFLEKGTQGFDPLPAETFVDYGLWFQKHAVPDVDETYITSIERKGGQFLLTLADGRSIQSKLVVMAPGLQYYIYSPQEYAHMPSSLVTHSADHHDLSKFAGRRVAVIGRGQAALETAALLQEQGVDVRVIARHSLRWVPVANTKVPAWIRTVRAPQAGMGNGWMNFLLEKYPYMLQRMSRTTIDRLVDTTHGPAGSHWLKPRIINKVKVLEQTNVDKIEAANEHARLSLSNGETLDVDHVILATGYRPDLQRLTMLQPSLMNAIQTYQGSPVLSTWFESSVPGLYFVGFSAARSFGPFYRFVIGTEAAARRVASKVVRQVVHSR
ncbi:MAG TPA: NAD(P)-binding domain-containing protein [Ktedonobacteraceae bacterium]|nr:NAD(P)-binding domain-containing protein [Ktedonobacteraceae bacterium]